MSTTIDTDLSAQNALAWGRSQLVSSESPGLDAQLLLAHALGRSRVWVLSHPAEPIGGDVASTYREFIGRRREGEPVAYIRGYVEWSGRQYVVTPDVLIPRPETELLLERALLLLAGLGPGPVIDVGTGSGALAIGLASSAQDRLVYASDVSPNALSVARGNAARLSPERRIEFLEANLLHGLPEPPILIVANLPYLTDAIMDALPKDVTYEPERALRGGSSGLELYEELLEQLRTNGWSPTIAAEIDPHQSVEAQRMFEAYLPSSHVWIESDLAGDDRFIFAASVGARRG